MDGRLEDRVWAELYGTAGTTANSFDLALVQELPEPARRYLTQAIKPGTKLRRVSIIEMIGDFGLGTRLDPKFAPMQASQILAGPDGFVWKMKSGPVSGSDGLGSHGSWTRFRLFGLIPVARIGFDENHFRSAFARAVAEAAFWAPASVLPGPGITWEEAGPDTVRLTVVRDRLRQSVNLTVGPDGRPLFMEMQRWTNANPAKVWQIQPFGATFGAIGEFDGYKLPVEVEAGNFFGTDQWFPFFRARVTGIKLIP